MDGASVAAAETSMSTVSGKRMQLLYAAHDKSIEKILKAGSFEKLVKEFPEHLGADRKDARLTQETIKKCYSQVLDSIVISTKEEFDAIVAELQMEKYLEKLDDLCVAARPAVNTPKEDLPRRHTSSNDVAVIARLHRIAQMEHDNAKLQEALNTICVSNTAAADQLQRRRCDTSRATAGSSATVLEQVVDQCEARDTVDVLAKAKASLGH